MDDHQNYSSPTFSSYSSNNLAAIAVRVTDEFNKDSSRSNQLDDEDISIQEAEDDFEFSLERDASSDVFFDGQIMPVFPIFNLDLNQAVVTNNDEISHDHEISNEIRIPLRGFLMREREQRDALPATDDDMANIPPGTYCVWKPKLKESRPNLCDKSNSTGSMSKRWKFLDLLRRSNSEGNENYVFLTPKHHRENNNNNKSEKTDQRPQAMKKHQSSHDDVAVAIRTGKTKTRGGGGGATASPSAHETFYVRNRAIKESDKKKSYLPQVLVGFFANVNALTRTYPPF